MAQNNINKTLVISFFNQYKFLNGGYLVFKNDAFVLMMSIKMFHNQISRNTH